MKRFGALLASAALGAALAASGPALAFRGGGGGGHMGRFGGGHFGGRSVAMGGFNRGFGFHRGFDHRFARFDHFHHFHRFRNRFGFFPFFSGGGWDYGYPYADCGYWGNGGNPYCGDGNPDYAYGYGYPNYAYSYPDYGYAYDYSYPATGSSGYYAAAPLGTGRSVATGQSYCTISVKACELHHPSYAGSACSCRGPGGRAPLTH